MQDIHLDSNYTTPVVGYQHLIVLAVMLHHNTTNSLFLDPKYSTTQRSSTQSAHTMPFFIYATWPSFMVGAFAINSSSVLSLLDPPNPTVTQASYEPTTSFLERHQFCVGAECHPELARSMTTTGITGLYQVYTSVHRCKPV